MLPGWRIGPFCYYLQREDAKTYEGKLGMLGVEGAGNNMSNFINGRERLRLPKSSVKDRGREQ